MNGQNAMNGGPGGMKIRQKLKDDLSKAGFTDIQMMPESFLVRAKDSSGNPVIMMINPNSITAITEENQGANSASNANHPEQNSGQNSTGGSQPVTPGGATKP